jgi:hypothetical protein
MSSSSDNATKAVVMHAFAVGSVDRLSLLLAIAMHVKASSKRRLLGRLAS